LQRAPGWANLEAMGKNKRLAARFTKPKHWQEGTFTNGRGLSLYFGQLARHQKPLAHIVYVAGLSEFSEKTYELARDFNKNACNFSVYDRPGQGRSPRLLDDPHKQHSTGTHQSVDDLIQFCKTQIPAGEKVVLLAHSTGGLIALEAMRREPALFSAAVMTGPLFGFKHAALKGREAYVARLPLPQMVRETYVPGGGPWKPRHKADRNENPDAFSSDKVRNKIHDYWMNRYPVLRTGSPTCGWVSHKSQAIMRIRDPEFLKTITQPVLVFTAGKDHLVENAQIMAVVNQLPNATHYEYKTGRHELLMEKDSIRSDLLFKKTLPFLKKHL